MAGLIAYYNSDNWVYLHIGHDDHLGRNLGIMVYDNRAYHDALERELPIGDAERVWMKVVFERESFRFEIALEEGAWQPIGPAFDAGKLSDDYCQGLSFTGTYIGLCCHDLSGRRKHADFDYFRYSEQGE
jgi:xylan 1,4-beta-xylosidase